MKKILYLFLALVILVVTIVAVFFDTLAKGGLESYAKNTLKTPVHIGEFNSNWSDAQVNIDFIEVENPKGFNNKNAFVLNHLSALLSTQTTDDLIVLEYLEFDGLLFTLEQNQQQVNLIALLKRLDNNSNTRYRKASATQAYNNKHPEKRLIIKNLNFINTQLLIDTQWVKDTVEVSDVRIRNFGANQGIPVSLVGTELMKIALSGIQKEIEKKGLKLNEEEIKAGIKHKLKDKLNELINNKAPGWLKKLDL